MFVVIIPLKSCLESLGSGGHYTQILAINYTTVLKLLGLKILETDLRHDKYMKYYNNIPLALSVSLNIWLCNFQAELFFSVCWLLFNKLLRLPFNTMFLSNEAGDYNKNKAHTYTLIE